MKLTKKQLMIGGGTAAVCALVVTASGVSAAAGTKPASLASEIASAFHLNQSDVQKVIDQHQTEIQAYRQDELQSRLDQDVKDGKITSAQETLILNEVKQVQSDMTGIKSLTGTARKTAMQQEWTKIQQWAKDNNIPLHYVMPHRGMGMGRGWMHPGGDPDDAPTASPSPSPSV